MRSTWRARLGWFLFATLVIAAAAALYVADVRSWFAPSRRSETHVTATVIRDTLPILISAGGELESSEGIEVHCDVEGQQTKIVNMLPDGASVKNGQVVMRLDPSEINDQLAQQEITVTKADAVAKAAAEELKIQKNLAASQIATADLALKLAELDREKYLEGDYIVEVNELKGSIALAKTELQEAEDTLEYYRNLVRKGFRTPEQLRAKQQALKRAEYNLNRDEEKFKVLETYTRKRQSAELTAMAAEAVRELERVKSSTAATVIKAQTDLEVAQATAGLERKLLERIQKQLEFCELRSPAAGTVVYAHEKKAPLDLGVAVYYKQKLFNITNMSEIRVKAFVHEGQVKKVRHGMPVEIKVDALPNLTLHGTVQDVGNFYDSTRHWTSGGVKEYETLIKVDQSAQSGLKPGMTAQVNILAGELKDSLFVPIPAVAQRDEKHYCYVVAAGAVQRRPVAIGASTEHFVEIKEGLQEDEKVALDARHRSAADLQEGGGNGLAGTGKTISMTTSR